jgi:hypothetical protein
MFSKSECWVRESYMGDLEVLNGAPAFRPKKPGNTQTKGQHPRHYGDPDPDIKAEPYIPWVVIDTAAYPLACSIRYYYTHYTRNISDK